MMRNLDLPIAETIRARLGDPVPVHRLDSSPRSHVWLVEFDGSPTIVKRITAGPHAADRYRREVTALQLAGRVRPAPVAALLATDPSVHVLVLEYLGGRRPVARAWAVDYTTTLARLHSALLPTDDSELPAYHGPDSDDIGAFLGLARRLDVPIPASVAAELSAVAGRLRVGDSGVLLHGDPCPDNAIVTDDGIRFVDLEQAQRGPAIIELAYLRIGFPTCWCVTALPQEHVADAETAYRRTWRSIRHADATEDVTDACVGWLIQGDALVERARRDSADHLARLTSRDWRWGTATARERLLHRLGVVETMTGSRSDLTGIATLTNRMRCAIRQRWSHLAAVPTAEDHPLTAS